MNPSRLLLSVLASLLLLFSCSKSNLNGFNYNFENLTNKPINLNIYSALSDYNNSANVYIKARMEVRGYYSIPVDKFAKGQTYYVDWYSDDLLYTNWYWSNITLRTAFRPTGTDYEYLVNTVQFSDPSRNIWMNGLGFQTTWKAIDAYNYSTHASIWSQLTSSQQNVHIVLNKDFSAHLIYENTSNQTIDSILIYHPNYDTINHLSVITLLGSASDSSVGTLNSNFAPSTFTFNGDNNTMLAYIKNSGYYQMVRQ